MIGAPIVFLRTYGGDDFVDMGLPLFRRDGVLQEDVVELHGVEAFIVVDEHGGGNLDDALVVVCVDVDGQQEVEPTGDVAGSEFLGFFDSVGGQLLGSGVVAFFDGFLDEGGPQFGDGDVVFHETGGGLVAFCFADEFHSQDLRLFVVPIPVHIVWGECAQEVFDLRFFLVGFYDVDGEVEAGEVPVPALQFVCTVVVDEQAEQFWRMVWSKSDWESEFRVSKACSMQELMAPLLSSA